MTPPPDETPADKPTRTEINRTNRNFGKSVERSVAKLTGGDRVPASGAIKTSSLDLTGDVQVRDADGRGFVKLECKGTSSITPSGDKTYTLKKSVLEQAFKEALDVGQFGVVWCHWRGAEYGIEDYAIIESRQFLDLLELAKLGAVVRHKGTYP